MLQRKASLLQRQAQLALLQPNHMKFSSMLRMHIGPQVGSGPKAVAVADEADVLVVGDDDDDNVPVDEHKPNRVWLQKDVC